MKHMVFWKHFFFLSSDASRVRWDTRLRRGRLTSSQATGGARRLEVEVAKHGRNISQVAALGVSNWYGVETTPQHADR